MKKTMKILTVALLIVIIAVSFSNVFAYDINQLDPRNTDVNSIDQDKLITGIGSLVINYLWVGSIIISVIVVMVLGIKYIIGSTEERAEYKKSMIPLVVGILLVVLATTIVNILFGMGNNI